MVEKIGYINERTAKVEILAENVEKYQKQGFQIVVLVRNGLYDRQGEWFDIQQETVEQVSEKFAGKSLMFFKIYGELITEAPANPTTLSDWWKAIKDHPFKGR